MITLVAFLMAPSSIASVGTPQEVSSRVGPPLPGTRHITMYLNKDYTGDTIIKFINVPDAYDSMDVKHADHAGMFWTFNNGETWLVLDNKRLFLTPDYGDAEIETDAGWPEDLPIMSPEELKDALKGLLPLEECQARLAAADARHEARAAEPRSDIEGRQSCGTIRCSYSYDCYPYSTSTVDCYRCNSRTHR